MSVRRSGVAAAAMLLLAGGAPLHAQQTADAIAPRAYETLTLRVSGARVLRPGSLDRYWQAEGGARLDVHTAFYLGEIGGFLLSLPYRARSVEQPAFRAYVTGLDWRFTVPAPAGIRPSLSATAGNFLMDFEGEQQKGLSKESEIFIGGTAALAVPLVSRTRLAGSVTAMHVLTSIPIRTAYASLGIEHTLTTPRWIRAVLE